MTNGGSKGPEDKKQEKPTSSTANKGDNSSQK